MHSFISRMGSAMKYKLVDFRDQGAFKVSETRKAFGSDCLLQRDIALSISTEWIRIPQNSAALCTFVKSTTS